MQDFGLLLKTLRMNAGYTQQELAALLHTTDSTISKWERSASVPDAVSIRKISQILNISCDELLSPTGTLKKINALSNQRNFDTDILNASDSVVADDPLPPSVTSTIVSVPMSLALRSRKILLAGAILLLFIIGFIGLYRYFNTTYAASSEPYTFVETRNDVQTDQGSSFEIVFYLHSKKEAEELTAYSDAIARDWRAGMYQSSYEDTLVVSFYLPNENISDWNAFYFRAFYLTPPDL